MVAQAAAAATIYLSIYLSVYLFLFFQVKAVAAAWEEAEVVARAQVGVKVPCSY